jgi:hypothetical protein
VFFRPDALSTNVEPNTRQAQLVWVIGGWRGSALIWVPAVARGYERETADESQGGWRGSILIRVPPVGCFEPTGVFGRESTTRPERRVVAPAEKTKSGHPPEPTAPGLDGSRAWSHGSRAWPHGSRAWSSGSRGWSHGSRAWSHGSRAWSHGSRAWSHGSRAWSHGSRAWSHGKDQTRVATRERGLGCLCDVGAAQARAPVPHRPHRPHKLNRSHRRDARATRTTRATQFQTYDQPSPRLARWNHVPRRRSAGCRDGAFARRGKKTSRGVGALRWP